MKQDIFQSQGFLKHCRFSTCSETKSVQMGRWDRDSSCFIIYIYFIITDRMQLRVNNGIRSNKYLPVDYDKLKLMAAEKKFSAQKSLLKVKKIEQMSKQSKENLLLKQHKLIWQKEFMRLNNLRKRAQAEVEGHRRQNATEGSGCCRMYEHFDLYEASLDEEFAEFKMNTCDPLWNLRYCVCFFFKGVGVDER